MRPSILGVIVVRVELLAAVNRQQTQDTRYLCIEYAFRQREGLGV
jgi:hypothetical protein